MGRRGLLGVLIQERKRKGEDQRFCQEEAPHSSQESSPSCHPSLHTTIHYHTWCVWSQHLPALSKLGGRREREGRETGEQTGESEGRKRGEKNGR